jgi:hypothetical protein
MLVDVLSPNREAPDERGVQSSFPSCGRGGRSVRRFSRAKALASVHAEVEAELSSDNRAQLEHLHDLDSPHAQELKVVSATIMARCS